MRICDRKPDFPAAPVLVEAKRRGEGSELSPEMAEAWKAAIGRAFDVLDAALARSVLPDEPPNVADVDSWLIALRRRLLDASR